MFSSIFRKPEYTPATAQNGDRMVFRALEPRVMLDAAAFETATETLTEPAAAAPAAKSSPPIAAPYTLDPSPPSGPPIAAPYNPDPALETGPSIAAPYNPDPVSETSPPIAAPYNPDPVSETSPPIAAPYNPDPALETGPSIAAPYNPDPALETGPSIAAPYNPDPVSEIGPPIAAPYNPDPVSEIGPPIAAPYNPDPVSEIGPPIAAPYNPDPVSEIGPPIAAPYNPDPVSEIGPPIAAPYNPDPVSEIGPPIAAPYNPDPVSEIGPPIAAPYNPDPVSEIGPPIAAPYNPDPVSEIDPSIAAPYIPDPADQPNIALAPDVGDSDDDRQFLAIANSAEPYRKEIVFIDAAIEDIGGLIADLDSSVEIYILDQTTDGVEQIASIVAGMDDLDAIHILSHGGSGFLSLGSAKLTEGSITGEHVNALLTIGNSLTEDGDILIYGCNFGEGDDGLDAARKLAEITGADIAASDDLTGHESLNGDWDLEIEEGEIQTSEVSAEDWQSTLTGNEAPTDLVTEEQWGMNLQGEVFTRVSDADPWQQVDNLVQVDASADGTIWAIDDNGDIQIKGPGQTNWTTYAGSYTDIAVNASGDAWALGPTVHAAGSEIFHWNDATNTWDIFGGRLSDIAVDDSGRVWGVQITDQIYTLESAAAGWQLISGGLDEITVEGDGTVWAVNAGGDLYHRDSVGSSWVAHGSGYLEVEVAPDGSVYAVKTDNSVVEITDKSPFTTSAAGTVATVLDVATISSNSFFVLEEVDGVVITPISTIDPDAGDTHTYAVDDARFEVADDGGGNMVLKLKAGESFDYETEPVVSVLVTTTDQGALSYNETFTINVTDGNDAPTDIAVDNPNLIINGSFEDFSGGVVNVWGIRASTLTGWTSETGEPFELIDDGLLGVSATDGDYLLDAAGYFNSHFTQVVNGALDGVDYTLSLDAADPNYGGQLEIYWGGALVATIDPSGPATQHYSFTVTGGSGDGSDKLELKEIDVSDGVGTYIDSVSLVRTGDMTVDENATGAIFDALSTTDPNAGDTHTYSVDDARFEVADDGNGNMVLKFKAGVSLDYETEQSVDVVVTTTDQGGLSYNETFTVTVNDINEVPTDIVLDNQTVTEEIDGATVGVVTTTDPDAGDAHTYAVDDARFEVADDGNGNMVLKLKAGVSLDYETEQSVDVVVTTTDQGALSYNETFTVNVTDANDAPTDLVTEEQWGMNMQSEVFTRTSDADPWQQVDNLVQVDASADGTIWAIDDNGDIQIKGPGQTNWSTYAGSYTDITVNASGDAWALGPTVHATGSEIFHWNDATNTWDIFGGRLSDIAVDDSGRVWGVQITDQIYTLESAAAGWQLISGGLDEITVEGDGTVWAVNAGGDLFHRDSVGSSWINHGPGYLEVEVAPDGSVYAVKTDNSVVEITDKSPLTTSAAGTVATVLDVATVSSNIFTVLEEVDGVVITPISTIDPDTGDTHTYGVDDARFEVADDGNGTMVLKLKTGESFDYETEPVVSVLVTTTDQGALSYNETFTINVVDANEAPVVAGAFSGNVAEDGQLTATGGLSISDVDSSDSPSFADVATSAGANGYGTFALVNGTWTYSLNNSHAAVQALDQGETLSDTFTFTASDGTQQQVTVTIAGAEDAPVVAGAFSGNVAEDGQLTATGGLSISDVDGSDSPSFADVATSTGANGYGTFALVNGTWTYSLNNSHAAVQALDQGETLSDTFTFTASDGTQQQVTVTIAGAEDAPVVAGAFSGNVAEDGQLTATGGLSISDVDSSDSPSFADVATSAGANGYGTFALVNGTWTYSLNNGHAAVQALDQGETLSDTFTFTASDGTQQQVTVTIAGAEDAPVVAGAFSGNVAEDGQLTATGGLSISDVDSSDSPSFADVATSAGANGYGTFALVNGTWTYSLNNGHAAVQALDQGETLSDTFTFTASDGTQQQVTVTIAGAEDAPVVAGAFSGNVAEDGQLTATGGLSISDVDSSDSPSFADVATSAGANGYGTFALVNGTWTYSLNNSHAAVQALDQGETLSDTFTFTASDGTQQQVTVTIAGAEDAPVVAGAFSGNVAEDGQLTATGGLSISDVDSSDSPSFADVATSAGANGYGTFALVNGTWTYSLNNGHAAVQALDQGETLSDTFTFTASDGTQQQVTVTIAGAEDAPVVAGAFSGNVAEDGQLTATGGLSISDVDSSDSPSFADVATSAGANGYGTFALVNGTWTYSLNNSHAAVQALDQGETLSDTFTFTASDGTQQQVTVTIAGAEDAPVVAGAFSGNVAEDGQLTATGGLSISDVDGSDSPSFADVATSTGANGYGTFALVNGTWTYSLNNGHAAVQALDQGETLSDTFTFTASDGTQQQVTVTIAGAEDAPVVAGAFSGNVAEDGQLTATGGLSISDVDGSDSPSFADVATSAGANGYGTFALVNGTWTYSLNNSHAAVQALDQGETLSDTFTFTASDGTQQQVTVTIAGAEDAPVVAGAFSGNVAEDGQLTATGGLLISDVDASDSPSFADVATSAGANGYGTFALVNGTWTYSLNNSHAAVQALDQGETLSDTFTFTASDGTQQQVTVTIAGAEDAPVVAGAFSGNVAEDGQLTATGGLLISDVDASDSPSFADVATSAGANGYGTFALVNGTWTYSLNNGHAAVQALDQGETLSDTFTFTASDGTQQQVTVTIAGAEDAPVVAGAFSGNVAEDGQLTATGGLSISDVDASDSPSFADVATSAGANGYGTFALVNGTWTYSLNNGHAAVQALDQGETLSDTFTFTASDGTQQQVTVTIAGAEDAPVVAGAFSGNVAEDGQLTATGGLSISDVDSSDSPSFADVATSAGANGYGTFALVNGTWTYSLNNSHAAVQALDQGETLSDTFTFTASDGTQQQVTVTIAGAEDAPVVAGAFSGNVAEDGQLTATGGLSISDVDGSDSPSFADVATSAGANGYGTFALVNGTWTYSLNNSHAAVQALDQGETLSDTFTFTASDGTQQQVTVTIAGAEDAPVVAGAFSGNVAEDGQLTATGGLSISDVDSSDSPSFADVATSAGANGYGTFALVNGTWTYSLNNSHAAVQALDQGETLSDTFTFTASDGTQQQVTVTIAGAEDAPVVAGAFSGNVAEDGQLTATGGLSISDVDGSDSPSFADVATSTGANGYGTFALVNGTWTYSLNNSHAAVQALDQGETLSDTFTFTASDGTQQQVTVTIAGAEDAPVVAGAFSGNVAEDGQLTATGGLSISDVDSSDSPSFADVATSAGANGYGTFALVNGTWTYSLNNSHAAVQALDQGETLSDTFTFTASDGTQQQVTVTIAGAEDAPVVAGAFSGNVAEDGQLTATGGLSISDVDGSDSPSFADVATSTGANGYGTFALVNGTWTYSLNNGHAAVQALDQGETLSDTFTFTASDGTQQQVTVTIAGAEDAPVVAGAFSGNVAEDGQLTATGGLSISDVDSSDSPSFADVATSAGANGYGTFALVNGTWTYSLNNGHAAVQALDQGETLSDTFTFTASDGTQQQVTVTIAGAEDAPVVAGAFSGNVAEDGQLTATGGLSISDVDSSDSPSFADVATSAGANGYGTFALVNGTWTYSLNNSHAAVQALDQGETLSDTFTFTASDGTQQQVTVTIAGAEDAPVVAGAFSGNVAEDGQLTATGGLSISDVDSSDSPSFADVATSAGANGYGTFALVNGTWTYSLNNGHAAVQALDQGETLSDTFTFTASDGTQQQVTVTIAGAEDAPVVAGAFSGNVAEDGQLTATGGLSISDVDSSDSPSFADVATSAGANGYGTFALVNGTWTYSLNNSHAAVQALDQGETLSDTFTFTASDGTQQQVTVTIAGAEDAPVVAGAFSGNVAEDGQLTATGGLSISDVDGSDSPSFADVATSTGANGYGTFALVNGTWTYSLNNSHAAVQALDQGETLSDTFTFTASDGTQQQVTVTIAGAEDAPVVAGAFSGNVAEDGQLTATGGLSISDVDSSDSPSFADVATSAGANGYGTFALVNGTWTYSLNNGHAAVQALDQGETLSDTFTFTASDGTQQQVTVTIAGAEDAPVVAGAFSGNVAEDGQLTATGGLLISDVDASDSPSFADVATSAGANGYGTFALVNGTWTYSLNNGHAAVQALDQGETLSDTFTFTASDGTQQQVTVTIAGAEDAPVVAGAFSGNVAEDGQLTATGGLSISDVDGSDSPSFADVATSAGANGYGTFALVNGTWTYSLNNGHAAVQALDQGETLSDTFTFTASDGTQQQVTVTIAGAEDAPVVAGAFSGNVAEDGQLTATGGLSISDVDSSDSPSFADVATSAGANGYGTFALVNGTWTYSLNNGHAAVQALDQGETLSDTFTFTASDGTQQQVTVTIAGAEDAPVVAGAFSGNVAEDGQLTATGGLSISDVDGSDSPSFADVATSTGANGYGTFALVNGTWTYSLNNSHAAVQALDQGETLSDTFTFTASDGTQQQVTVTIAGAEDAPVVAGAFSGNVAEDGQLTATGGLSISDVDSSDSPSFADVATSAGANGYGTFALVNGTWTYSLNNGHAAVQALDQGETLSDTFTFTASDGTQQQVTVTIAGAEDAPVVAGAFSGNVAEDGQLTATGGLSISDVDGSDSPSFADVATSTGANGYGTFALVNGTWTYSLNNSHAAVQALDQGETLSDTFTFTASDGTQQQVTVTIAGAEDAPVVAGAFSGNVAEDGQLTATGGLSISDVDSSDSPSFADVATSAGANGYGTFALVNGTWTYSLNNSHAAVQALDQGETLSDTFTFTASDGTQQQVTVTIAGAEDAPVVAGAFSGNVAEDGQLTATGGLSISDVDGSDSPSFADVATSTGANGYGTFALVNGTWTYSLNNSHAAVQALDQGETLSDTFTFTASDGTQQQVTVTIAGAEDAPVVAGAFSGNVAEDGQLTATGGLSISDVDSSDSPSFADVATSAGANGYGTFALVNGTWTYSLNNSHAAVQALDQGETLSDTFTFTASDGTQQQVTVTIAGAEDAPVVAGAFSGNVAEDGQLTATGGLSISDVDSSDSPSFADVATSAGANGYGTFALVNGTWTYSLNNGHAAVQALDQGETLSDTFTFTASDGTQQQVTVTIAGAEDAPVVAGAFSGNVAEDGQLTATGGLSISDVDASDSPSFADVATSAGANGYGTFALVNGTWTYSLNNSHSAVQALDQGETLSDTFTFTASDGTQQQVTVTIAGAEDAPVVAGAFSGNVAEDGQLTATGGLSISDVDGSDSPSFADVATSTGANGYGTFALVNGTWTYSLNNSHAAVQALDQGETLSDTFTFTASDGTQQQVTVTIAGAEDAPVVAGAFSGNVAEDGQLTATGGLSISDVDSSDSPSFADVATSAGANGYGTFALVNGTWTYSLNNGHAAVQALDQGETLSDTFTFTASDGTQQQVTVTIAGAEDAPVVAGAFSGNVAEDGQLTATGGLLISDVDASDSPSFADVATSTGANGYGTFALVNGTWTYSLNNSHAAVQALDQGETLSDTFTFTASDGTQQQVTVTIAGAEDAPVVAGAFSGNVAEDGQLTATGGLLISDVDASDSPSFADVATSAGANGYGTFALVNGTWTYSLNNGHAAVQALDQGETLSDTFTFTASDGTQQQVTVTIAGAEDAPVVAGAFSGNVAEDGQLTATGGLLISDVDASDSPSFADVATSTGANGYGTFALVNGTWTYSLNNSHAAVQALDQGETLSDTFTFTASDGTQQQVTVTIAGAEDAPVVAGAFSGNVAEDGQLTATGGLLISDVDASDSPSFADVATSAGANGYGTFALVNGTWTYSLNNGHAAVQALDQGETLSDTFTFTASDGTQQQVTVTIAGAEDAPVVAGAFSGNVAEDGQLTATGGLSISDVDASDSPSFADVATSAGANGYGTFALVNGTWTYSLNNGHAAVQALDQGETLSDTFTFTASDGTQQQVTVTIAGAEDAPVVAGAFSGNVAEDGQLTATGGLSISDVDASDSPSFADVATSAGANGYGTFALVNGTWTYSLNNGHAAVQALDQGETLSDTFTFTASDGTQQQVTVTIAGAEDAPVVAGAFSGNVAEDGQLTATGGLSISDVDSSDSPSFADVATSAGANGYGTFALVNGTWTYSLNNSHAAVQALDQGETLSDTFTFTASDGTQQQVTVTIAGAEDAPVVAGAFSGNVAEDGQLTATGGLSISDVDGSDSPSFADVATSTGANGYGTFALVNGTWTYSLNNSHAAVQALDQGETLSDTFTFTASDGTQQQVTVTIAGAEDAPVVAGAFSGNVAEDGQLTATGGLSISDVDSSDSPSFADVATSAGANGYGTFALVNGTWTYSLNNGHAAVQALDQGETLSDTFTFTASDGTQQQVTVTIAGAEDAPVVAGAFSGNVAEDGQLTATGGLSISDVDGSDSPSFADVATSTGANGYGTFALVNGTWTYSLNNGHAAVQALDQGETLSDTFTFTASDGTQQQVTVTIAGAEDAPVVAGAFSGNVAEDGQLTATGGLSISDVDASDSPSFADVATSAGANGYGTFALVNGTWTYSLNNGHAAVQALDQGETLSDTFTFTASDGTQQQVTVTIAGAEDAPVVAGAFSGNVAEDGQLTATGGLSISDVDASDSPSFADVATSAGANGYGTFALVNGTWTYSLNNSHSAVQALDQGETLSDTFTFTASDGTQQQVTVTIAGAEDAPVVAGAFSGNVAEDGQLTATGGLSISDVDGSDSPSFADVATSTGANGYGTFALVNGTWTYSLNNSHAAVQALDQGETLSDTFTFTASDGTQQQVTVTIAGAEDAPVVAGAFSGNVAEDGQLTATGGLSISDVDSSDSPSFADVATSAGANGYGTFALVNGTWTYSLNNSHAAVQALDQGETLSDTFTFTASDGTQQQVTVTIAGAEDAPVVAGAFSGNVAEDGQLTATGGLSISDVDSSDSPSFADVATSTGANGYGTFALVNGTWTYSLNNGHAAVQALDQGETLSDTFTFTASDGTQQQVTVTIAGAEDAPVVAGAFSGNVAEDGQLTATGGLSISDVDSSDSPSFADVATSAGANGYGTFALVNGTWTYSLNNGHAAVQALDQGETLSDTFTFTASDGTQQQVTVTIAGAEDAPVVAGAFSGNVAEDGQLTATGGLSISDVDSSDSPSFADVATSAGANGYGTFALVNGTWTYSLNNSHAAVQALDQGETLSDTFTFTASDGTQQQVTVTIAGAEDAPVVAGAFSGNVAEDGQLTATGGLSISDVDASDSPSFADVATSTGANGYGTFALVNGTWTYSLNNGHAAVQALDQGETLSDTFTFTASDGTQQQVTVTIAGAEDAPVVVDEGKLIHDQYVIRKDVNDGPTDEALLDFDVQGIVVKTTNSFGNLNSIDTELQVGRVVTDAVHTIDDLNSVASPEENGQPIREQIEKMENINHSVMKDLDRVLLLTQADPSCGSTICFPLGGSDHYHSGQDGNEMMVETIVRKRTLFIDVRTETGSNINELVSKLEVKMADGEELPDWIKVVRDGFIVVERPVDLRTLDLALVAVMANGNEIEHMISIDAPTGEIKPMKAATETDDNSFTKQLKLAHQHASSNGSNDTDPIRSMLQ